MTKIFVAIANDCGDVDTSSHVIGVFTGKALAIRAAVKSYYEGGIFSWYIKEGDIDSAYSLKRTELSEAEIKSALKEQGDV